MKAIAGAYLLLQLLAGYYLWTQVSDFLIHFLFTLPAVVFYLLACLRNPGFVDFKLMQPSDFTYDLGSAIESSSEIFKDDKPVKIIVKKCAVCKYDRLLRMKHCYDCNSCVATFDHHCIWIDNCVGEKNRHVFYLCILTNLAQLIAAFALLVGTMWHRGQKNTDQIFFLSFLGVLAGGLLALTALHTYLMLANSTTWELIVWKDLNYFKGSPFKVGSPYSNGIFQNLRDYWGLPFSKQYKKWIPKTLNEWPQDESPAPPPGAIESQSPLQPE